MAESLTLLASSQRESNVEMEKNLFNGSSLPTSDITYVTIKKINVFVQPPMEYKEKSRIMVYL